MVSESSNPTRSTTTYAASYGLGIATFVKEQIEPADGEILPLGDCLDLFESMGGVTLSRKDATGQLKSAITSLCHVRFRNDLSLPNGRAVSGWTGLRPRHGAYETEPAEMLVSSIRLSVDPNSSESSGKQVSEQGNEQLVLSS